MRNWNWFEILNYITWHFTVHGFKIDTSRHFKKCMQQFKMKILIYIWWLSLNSVFLAPCKIPDRWIYHTTILILGKSLSIKQWRWRHLELFRHFEVLKNNYFYDIFLMNWCFQIQSSKFIIFSFYGLDYQNISLDQL
jgi:hypothetical protein